MQNEPQLTAEMEKRFDDEFYNSDKNDDYGWLADMQNNGDCGDKIKHFLATALEEQKQELLSEVESWLDEMPVWIKIEGKYGYDPIHNKADISPFRQELRAKLNQLKGGK